MDFMTKMERQRDEKVRQEMSDNRSFLAKYVSLNDVLIQSYYLFKCKHSSSQISRILVV